MPEKCPPYGWPQTLPNATQEGELILNKNLRIKEIEYYRQELF